MTRKSIWLKLIITDVIMGACIIANGCFFIEEPKFMSLLAMVVAGIAIGYCTPKYLKLLKKGKNVLR